MHKNESWLESALRRDLMRVEAPAELWERVQNPPAQRRETGAKPLAWALAALLVVAAVLGLRARESHAAGAVTADLQSGDPAQIRAWVRSSTGLDIALPDVLSQSVRLVGARVVNPTVPSVQVAYRVGDRDATLLVARTSDSGSIRHADLRTVNNDGKITWIMHGQMYTLSGAGPLSCTSPLPCTSPDDARVACLLCHVS
jgi:hypothetical protein